jgi:hypothetical protein
LLALTIFTTDSMTGTSINTPTTVASAAPEWKPNRLIAAGGDPSARSRPCETHTSPNRGDD